MNAEYVTDVPYGRTFVDDISPSRLRLVAALNGFPISTGDDFDYCELGSAQGETITVLAAANPRARFLGVDLAPVHVAFARGRADRGKVDNVRFLERDFENLAEEPVPDLDFITAHGVLSWIGPAKRKALLRFAAAKLKPGGFLYVGYNAQPGWAAVEPLRALLVRGGEGSTDSQERARRGLSLASALRDAGALYFKGNASAAAMLDTMKALGPPYIAHEYLNAHWEPLYFAQVAAEMAESDLYFVGSFPLYSNYRDLAVPASLREHFATVNDRGTLESLKDYALNEFFRRDVFVKGRTGRSAAVTQTYLDTTSFGITGGLPADRKVRLPHHVLDLHGRLFETIFDELGEGRANAMTLAKRASLANDSADDVRAALLRAILGDCIGPMPGTETPSPSAGDGFAVPSAYNRMVLRQTLSSDTPFILASPVTARGHSIAPLDALCLRLLTEVPRADWESWTRSLLTKQGVELTVRGTASRDDGESARAVLAEVERLRASSRFARWLEWRIVERGPLPGELA